MVTFVKANGRVGVIPTYMYMYNTRQKKTAPKSFNTIPFRYNNERTIWNGNVAQRYFIPFRSVSFCFVLFGNVQLLQEPRAENDHSERVKARAKSRE